MAIVTIFKYVTFGIVLQWCADMMKECAITCKPNFALF